MDQHPEAFLRSHKPNAYGHESDNTEELRMKNHSAEFDAYIAKSAEFAQPILKKLRRLFHQACPSIEETIKWGFPHFEYRGIGSMAAFKNHVSFGFWKAKLLSDSHKLLEGVGETSMGGARIKDVSELPSDQVLLAYIREAVALNEQGVRVPAAPKAPKAELEIPDYFLAALRKNKKALATFKSFSPSHQREYVEWVTEAKQPATRDKRLATAIEWMAQGKPRNWKYMKDK
jgi:uncharacterized protein YdeI (YjbR/CyaY-like superfamily)